MTAPIVVYRGRPAIVPIDAPPAALVALVSLLACARAEGLRAAGVSAMIAQAEREALALHARFSSITLPEPPPHVGL